MSSESVAPYVEAATAIGGIYQRFQYGFGGYIEVMLTLLQKQHWQAAADIMPLIQREKVSFEGVLLDLQNEFAQKSAITAPETGTEGAPYDAGPISCEAPNP